MPGNVGARRDPSTRTKPRLRDPQLPFGTIVLWYKGLVTGSRRDGWRQYLDAPRFAKH
jgi:hypothetical protein